MQSSYLEIENENRSLLHNINTFIKRFIESKYFFYYFSSILMVEITLIFYIVLVFFTKSIISINLGMFTGIILLLIVIFCVKYFNDISKRWKNNIGNERIHLIYCFAGFLLLVYFSILLKNNYEKFTSDNVD